MGHASRRAALIYQHRTIERDRAIAEALDAMCGRGSERHFGHVLGTDRVAVMFDWVSIESNASWLGLMLWSG